MGESRRRLFVELAADAEGLPSVWNYEPIFPCLPSSAILFEPMERSLHSGFSTGIPQTTGHKVMAAHAKTGTITPEARRMASALSEGGELLGRKLDKLTDNARGMYDRGVDALEGWEEGVESYVKHRPVRSLLIAAGVGAIIGALFARR